MNINITLTQLQLRVIAIQKKTVTFTIHRSGNVGARSLSTKNPVFKLMAVLNLMLLRADFQSILLEHTHVIMLPRLIC